MAKKRLDELLAKREAMNELIRREQAKARAQERKDDTRRKILVGSVMLNRADRNPVFKAELDAEVERALVRAEDRALFGLAPLTGHPLGKTPEESDEAQAA